MSESQRPRSKARASALKLLYQLDMRADLDPAELFPNIDAEVGTEDGRRFARDLTLGVRANLELLDAELEAVAINWRLQRMAVIDRNVLRLGAYEVLLRGDIPPAVSINEAVQLAKTFSTKDSGGFVNGILDKIRLRAEAGETAVAPAASSEAEE